jgi:hypothetical protein
MRVVMRLTPALTITRRDGSNGYPTTSEGHRTDTCREAWGQTASAVVDVRTVNPEVVDRLNRQDRGRRHAEIDLRSRIGGRERDRQQD